MKFLLVMFFAVMLTVSCSKDEPGVNDPALVGAWKMTVTDTDTKSETYIAFTQKFTFNSDLSGNIFGISYDPDDSTNSEVFNDVDFTYTAQNSELLLKATINGNSVTDPFSYSITKDTLTLVDNSDHGHGVQKYLKQ